MTRAYTIAGLALTGLAALTTAVPARVGAQTVAAHHLYTVREAAASGHYVFQPQVLKIHAGDMVRWVDVTDDGHNVVGTGTAASVIRRQAVNKDSYTLTFRKQGTYHYVCQVHQGMAGVVIVMK